jgi:uncharacterized MAPEG superfamily protein
VTPELTTLALAGLLQVVQYALFAVPANKDLGTGYTSSARDRAPSRELSPLAGRMQRAFNNHFEGLILFTLAVVVVTLGGKASGFTAACAWTYLAARTLYIPAYAYDWRPWRSAIWFVGFFATVAMIIASLL